MHPDEYERADLVARPTCGIIYELYKIFVRNGKLFGWGCWLLPFARPGPNVERLPVWSSHLQSFKSTAPSRRTYDWKTNASPAEFRGKRLLVLFFLTSFCTSVAAALLCPCVPWSISRPQMVGSPVTAWPAHRHLVRRCAPGLACTAGPSTRAAAAHKENLSFSSGRHDKSAPPGGI